MKKINLYRFVILGCFIALFNFASVTHTFGQSGSITTAEPVRLFSDQSVRVPRSGSMLVRSGNGVFGSVNTTGLAPGTVTSAWIAIFNTPSACATNPCTAIDLDNPAVHGGSFSIGARIVGADGAANLGGFRAVGDISDLFRGTRGLILPMSAEIHLVIRTHGAASSDPAVLAQQLTMFNGGCPPNTCSNVQITIHQQ